MRERRLLIKLVVVAALVAGSLIPAPPAHAFFHLMKVTEVFAGTSEQPNAQFVELQMHANDQRFVATHRLVIFDSSDAELGTFVFTSAVPNGTSQSYILIATPEAETLFGVEADLEMTPVIIAGGGKACFRHNNGSMIDCVSWGTYSGNPFDTGTPFNSPVGLSGDQSMRRITSTGDPSGLDSKDDTNDSEADFEFASPRPTNNAGVTGALPTEPPPPEVVTHARSVTLSLKGSRRLTATGMVTAEGDFEQCFSGVLVKLQRRSSGRWSTVKSTTTDTSGNYRVTKKDRTGKYRAKVPELQPAEDHLCSAAVSPTRKRQ